MAILHELNLNHPDAKLVTATHNGRTYRFNVRDDVVIAARVKIEANGRRSSYWRNIGLDGTAVAAANGNGLIVKE